MNDAAEMAKDVVAKELAEKHFEIEVGLTHIFRINSKPHIECANNEPIKLLEVNENTVAAGVMPLHFGPAPASGIPFPSIIVEVTPGEFERIKTNELRLPDGWEIGEEFFKPAHDVGGH